MGPNTNMKTFDQRVPATSRSLARLRGSLRQWLEPAVSDPDRRADIVLAASELGAVAVRTAHLSGSPVEMHAWVDDDDVVLECRAEQPPGSDANAALEFERTETERGFSIVASLAHVLAVEKAPLNVVLRARLRCRVL